MKLLEQQLEKNEQLIWWGKPAQGFLFYPVDIFMIPFSIVWGGISVTWEVLAIIKFINKLDANSFFFMVFGFPFTIIGLYILFGRYITDKVQRKNIYYGISNKRIIIVKGNKNQTATTIDLNRLSIMNIYEKKNRKGNISFGKKNPFDIFYVRGMMPRDKYTSPKFEMIENVREVYSLIKEIQAKA